MTISNPNHRLRNTSIAATAALTVGGLVAHAATPTPVPARKVEYNRDIRPILSGKCFTCHGPDEKRLKAGLRLDLRDAALQKLPSGAHAIVPGKPGASELVRRILSADRDTVMPPPASLHSLTAAEKSTLQQWIAQGAGYQQHWAFIPPVRPALPAVRLKSWPRNELDYFILARLEREGLKPSPEADRTTLIRRLTLDLTGLPPTPAEVDAYLADRAPNAYEKVVDRLLASPRYGERMAAGWLDGARYADSNGYQTDSSRSMWPWRDWVVRAFNENKPYDQFITEQLAGDLLPNATVDQKIATGFNRNHRINEEGGSIPEEWRIETVIDRVETTSGVFLGLTAGCARCHDHKFDPISQKEFYGLFAFFNNVPESGMGGGKATPPFLRLGTPAEAEKLKTLNAALAAAEADLAKANANGKNLQAVVVAAKAVNDAKAARDAYDAAIPTVMVMEEMAKPRDAYVLIRGQYDKPGPKVTAGTPSALTTAPIDAPPNRLGLAKWITDPRNPLTARVAVNRVWERLFGIGIVKTTEDFGVRSEWPSHPEALDWLATSFAQGVGSRGQGIGPNQAQTSPRANGSAPIPGSPAATGPRRGENLNTLTPPTPGSRLDPKPYPLDPARPWDLKALQKTILMSATYRQSSRATPALVAKDPDNRLLARGPRFRMPAEMIRDSALAISGLLVDKLGGPPVRPYQPDGVWDEITAYGDLRNYRHDKGEGLYRRSLYTIWKRTSAPPSMTLFDAPGREVCTVRRSRTNTPLQALALLNDVTYLEASRVLAQRMLTEGGATAEERITYAFRRATSRRPSPSELRVLADGLRKLVTRYRQNPEAATKLISFGDYPRDPMLDPAELAAYTMTASTLLNLDETITKE